MMKNEWEARAQADYMHAVAGGNKDGKFWEIGEIVVQNILEPRLQQLGIVPSNSRVLEIGCGSGRVTRQLAGLFNSVVALDISPTMLDLARNSTNDADNVVFVESNGSQFSGIEDSSIDVACSTFVFQHMPTIDVIRENLAEIHRVVKPGGAFIIDTSYQRGGWWRTNRGKGLPVLPRKLLWMLPYRFSVWLATRNKPVEVGTVNTWHGNKPMSAKQLRTEFTNCGLTIDDISASYSLRNIAVSGRVLK